MRPVHLGEHVEDASAATSAGMPIPVSRTDTTTSPPAPLGGQPDAAAPARCTWRCWSAGCRTPAPAGSGRRRGTPARPGATTVSSCPAASISGRAVSTALPTTSASEHARPPQLHLVPADPGDVEQVVDQPHHVRRAAAPSSPGPGRRRPASPPASRITCRPLRIGASGLRSSWASSGEELVLPPVGLPQLADQPQPLVGDRDVVADGPQELQLVGVELVAGPAGEGQGAEQAVAGQQRVAGVGPDAERP